MKIQLGENAIKQLFLTLSIALIVVGCASTRPVAERSSGPVADGDGAVLEEIVVSGTSNRAPTPVAMSSSAPQGFANAEPDLGSAALALVQPGEEVWVIAKPKQTAQTPTHDNSPGSGAMVVELEDDHGQMQQIPLPLEHTDVNAKINGYISSVNVRQRFGNPFAEKIEAVYMFPLPQDAAVSEFLMIIGERRIRGILREKEQAEAIYYAARAQGYQASLLVQHRPNVFEQRVANIEPGKTIEVDIRYFNTLAYSDGWYSFVFPTVVGPRFNPPGSADPIGTASRESSNRLANTKHVSYLRPSERSGHDISISIDLHAGVNIEDMNASHSILTSDTQRSYRAVSLASKATIPNKDFVLNFRVAGDKIKSNLLTWVNPSNRQGYFTMALYPPTGLESLSRQPVEMVFVLDCSGSMSGRPIEQAKAAVSAALGMLSEGDTFQIIRFSDNASQFGKAPIPASAKNIARARSYLRRLHGSGGTMMIEGVKTALDFPHDPKRLRFVSFMTDGYIGNEADIIGTVHDRIGDSRIFSFGVGSSVNRYLLEHMAKEGRGVVAYLGPKDSGKDVMQAFFHRIGHPALTDLSIDWGAMQVSDVYPSRIPDLFVGRPVFVSGRFDGEPDGVHVTGRAGGSIVAYDIATDATASGNEALSKIWARLRIADLADRQAWQPDPHGELEVDIRKTALEHQLMSAYTAFVAVDSSYVTEGEYGTTVHQAVPLPDGVRYGTTVDAN